MPSHGVFETKRYNVGVYIFTMWKKLKNMFKRSEKEKKSPKAKTADQILKKVLEKPNETPEERKRRIKTNKRITEANL